MGNFYWWPQLIIYHFYSVICDRSSLPLLLGQRNLYNWFFWMTKAPAHKLIGWALVKNFLFTATWTLQNQIITVPSPNPSPQTEASQIKCATMYLGFNILMKTSMCKFVSYTRPTETEKNSVHQCSTSSHKVQGEFPTWLRGPYIDKYFRVVEPRASCSTLLAKTSTSPFIWFLLLTTLVKFWDF